MNEEPMNWPLAFLVIAFFLSIASVLGIIAWQAFATWRSRMSIAREEAYRTLAEQATSAQQRTMVELQKATAALDEIRMRTAEVERLLKEVG